MADPRRRPAPVRARQRRRDRVHDPAGRRLGGRLRVAQPRLRDARRRRGRGREPPACAARRGRRPGARTDASARCIRNVVLEAAEGAPGAYLAAATAWPEADALVTSQPGLPLVAHGGDCLTVALVAGDGRRLATVHAGWRGLVAGVLEAAAERVGEGFSGVIGPGAGRLLLRRGSRCRGAARRAFRRGRRRRRARRPRGLRAARARAQRRSRGRERPPAARSATPSGSIRTAATGAPAAARP